MCYLIQFTYVSTVALQQEGSGFEPTCRLGSFGLEFACSPHTCMGFLWVLLLWMRLETSPFQRPVYFVRTAC